MADGNVTLKLNVTTGKVDTSSIQDQINKAIERLNLPTQGFEKQVQALFENMEKAGGNVDKLWDTTTQSLQNAKDIFADFGQQEAFNNHIHQLTQLGSVMEKVITTIQAYAGGWQQISADGTTTVIPPDMERAISWLPQLISLLEQYNQVKQDIIAESDALVDNVQPSAEEMVTPEDTSTNIVDEGEVSDVEAVDEAVEDLSEDLELAASRSQRLRETFGLWGGSFSGIKSNMIAMADGMHEVLGVAHQLGTSAFKGMKKGISGIIGKFREMGKQASRSADTVQKKMKRTTLAMIKAMIGVRGLYMLFRKLRQAIKESMDTLAQNVPEFNQVFSEFKTALNGIKGSIGTAFQPILQAVLPILTQLANALANVMTMIGKFNAVLMGQNYIYKFTAAQQDYAKSLKGTGSAAKKATKDLMGFDEINRLSDKDSGGGGGSSGIGDYEKEMIDKESAISEFAEMVKKAWEESDFTQVGREIGISIRDALFDASYMLDTEGQQWAKKLSASLSTLINGLVDVPGFGYSIGKALGSGINVGITFLRDFWRDTNWTGVGEQLGGAINGLFDKVDWVGLGEYFGFRFNGIFDFIGGLADSTHWDNIGTSLATSLNTMIETMDVGSATSNVSKLIVGIFDSGIAFLTTTDWEDVGGKLADGLAGIDWKNLLGKAGTLISKGAQGILDMVIGFVKKTDWNKTTQDIIDGIGEMFENIWDDGNLIQKLGEGFGALLGAAIIACINIGGFIYDNVVKPLIEALEKEFEDADTGNIGTDIIYGIFKGILDALIGIGKWIADNIVTPIIDGICEAFGIHSPATTMIEIGAELVAGLLQGLQDLWDTIKEPFETALEGIQGLFSGIGTWFSDRWEDIKGAFTSVGSWFSETFQGAWDNITGVFESIGSWFSDRWDDITGAFKDVGSWFSEKFGEAWENIKSAFSTVGSFFQGIFDDIKGIFSTIGDEIGSAVSTAFQSAVNWILEKAVNLINGFIDGLNMAIDIINLIPKVDIDKIDRLDVPQLAEGAVLPPNQPFLAMVGDQTSGTNVEAPLDTIKQAVAEVIMENNDILTMGFEAVVQAIQNKDMSVRIGDKDIGQATARYNSQMNIMRGTT